jgi:putative aldouronate transport system permease protein
VVLGGILTTFLSSQGVVNRLMIALGLQKEAILYLGIPGLFRPLLILSELWKEVGWGSIIYLAVIATIDPNLYEAVEIDGGGRWAKIRHVTWPFVTGVFVIGFILSCGRIFSGLGGSTFEQVYILGNPSVYRVAEIIDTYVLRVGLEQGRYSFATAVGLFRNIINLLLLVAANRLSKKLSGKSLF